MKKILILLIMFHGMISVAQQPLIFKGKVGNYQVEVQIESNDPIDGTFTGRYRYEGKKTFLDVSGEYAPPVIYMEEYYKGDTTGYWYLELHGDSISGIWVGGDKAQTVYLSYSSGDRSFLKRKTEYDYNKEVSGSLTGDYEVNDYFINDMWVSEINLRPELGYNGGLLTVKEREDGNIDFVVEAVCGPTYHIAFANGIAKKDGNLYIYTNEDGCSITFAFKDKKVNVESNNSMDCGFGARAYLSHEFVKVRNQPTEVNEH